MRTAFSTASRKPNLLRLERETFDLAIIGGGITGAGVARDAASRGMKVALIEAGDFASGTSSRSSKLIHGGIRYLENLEFHLVFEALSERQRLFEMAPHLVHPLRFLLPVYKSGRVPAWKMGLGMWVYDALSLFEAPELNQYLSVEEVHREFPYLKIDDLSGAFAYYDAYMDDDRLVHETLRSAVSHGALAANYVRATGAQIQDGRVTSIECEDLEGKTKFQLRARHIVSSVGPWTDRLGQDLFKDWKKRLRPSKGVHLTFRKERFPLKDAVVMGAEARIVFAIPRHEMVIVGTTDTDFGLDPSKVRAETEDVDYLLRVIDNYFPGARITQRDIVGCYAGVRPLIADDAETESKTSREHVIWTDPRGITFVAGGKYTTYRNMAEQTVIEVLRHFDFSARARFAHSQTLQPLNPVITESWFERAQIESSHWARKYRLPAATTAKLAARHGLESLNIIETALSDLTLNSNDQEWLWNAEALHAVDHTMCLHLADFYFRRTPLVLAEPDHGLRFVKSLAGTMAARLGWSKARELDEINALQNQLAWDLAATLSS